MTLANRISWIKHAHPLEALTSVVVCVGSYFVYPASTPWITVAMVLIVPAIWLGREADAKQTLLATDRLRIWGGDQQAAYAAFLSDLGQTGCDAEEVALIYHTIQDVVSPINGPKMPLRVDDSLLDIAFDEDDIDLDALTYLTANLPRNFDDWDKTVQVSKTETLGELVHLMALFPKA